MLGQRSCLTFTRRLCGTYRISWDDYVSCLGEDPEINMNPLARAQKQSADLGKAAIDGAASGLISILNSIETVCDLPCRCVMWLLCFFLATVCVS